MSVHMPPSCEAIIKRLNENGFEAYLVGGCVRDMLLGEVPNDWDICSDALPEEMQAIFPANRVLPTGLKHGTVTILQDGDAIEVTTYRHDGVYEDHRRPKEVTFTKSLSKDLARRDFTINALAWHPETGLVDEYDGLKDLDDRIVRAVGNPWTRFEEDGLRIMRMVRFATCLAFEIDRTTLQAAKEKVHLLTHISKERLKEEFDKILLSEDAARGLSDLADYGIFPYLIPEKCHEIDFEHDPEEHFLDLFEHTALTCALLPKRLPLRIAGMAHGIGNPFVSKNDPSGHEGFSEAPQVGAELANLFLRRLRYDNKSRKRVVRLIKAQEEVINSEAVALRRLLRKYGEETLKDLIELRLADQLARRKSYAERLELEAEYERICSQLNILLKEPGAWQISHLAVSGHDIMALGYKGPAIKEALEFLLDHVVEDPNLNRKEELFELLTQHPKP